MLAMGSGCHGRSSATVTRGDGGNNSGNSTGNASARDASAPTGTLTKAPPPMETPAARSPVPTDRNASSTGALTVTVTWRKPPLRVHERAPQCAADLPSLPMLSTTRMVNEVLVFVVPEARTSESGGPPPAAWLATKGASATAPGRGPMEWLGAALTARACGVAPRLHIVEPAEDGNAAVVVRRDIGGPRVVHVFALRDWPGAQAFAAMAAVGAPVPVSAQPEASAALAPARFARASLQLPVPGHAAAMALGPGLYQIQGEASMSTATDDAPPTVATVLISAWPAAVTGTDGNAHLRVPAGAYRVFAYVPPQAHKAIAGQWMHAPVQVSEGASNAVAFDLADAESSSVLPVPSR